MTRTRLSRRSFLTRTAALGCSAAASPLVTPISLAAAPWESRLVVIILRGGMDGLDVVRPLGDPDFASLGRTHVGDKSLPLDGFFSLNPALRSLMPMWDAGDLGFVQAVSTPYRDKRSHFDGQDLLEAGITSGPIRDGWLNRLLQLYPGLEASTAFAVGRDEQIILNGPAPTTRWAPDTDLALSPQAMRLAQYVMREDPAFAKALSQAYGLAESDGDPVAFSGNLRALRNEMADDMMASRPAASTKLLAQFTAQQLKADTRIASFSLTGWDTHDNQVKELSRALGRLADTLTTLRDELGPVWGKTTVLAMTEFGRTARMNGTGGSDHGTGGTMLFAGGAVQGGRVLGDWPGLSEADLYERRDLMPTRDLRAYAAWAMRGLFGTGTGALESSVFPGLEMGPNPGLLL